MWTAYAVASPWAVSLDVTMGPRSPIVPYRVFTPGLFGC